MFWSKKDKNQLPDLPMDSPILPQLPENERYEREDEEDNEKHSLPAFPDSPIKKGFSQTAIKEAIENEEVEEKTENEKRFKTQELESIPMPPSKPRIIESDMPKSPKQDVFVQIDKFYSARRALSNAQEKLEDIDALLSKIRETKLREEQELASWEKEVQGMKMKIKEVTETIFEKIE